MVIGQYEPIAVDDEAAPGAFRDLFAWLRRQAGKSKESIEQAIIPKELGQVARLTARFRADIDHHRGLSRRDVAEYLCRQWCHQRATSIGALRDDARRCTLKRPEHEARDDSRGNRQ